MFLNMVRIFYRRMLDLTTCIIVVHAVLNFDNHRKKGNRFMKVMIVDFSITN